MFNKYFKDEYQFSLKQVLFQTINEHDEAGKFEINVSDDISVDVVDDGIFVDYWRNIYFEPKGIFEIKVNFGLKIFFRDETKLEAGTIDWAEKLKSNENPYIRNVAARASTIVSNLTSSYGQQPIITPPILVN